MDNELFDGQHAHEKAMQCYENKDFRTALELFNKAIDHGLIDNIYQFRADCQLECGFPELAIKDYDMAISLNPNDCNIYFSRSNVKMELGNIDGAIEDLKEAIRLSKIDNALNDNYHAMAIDMGWPDGHTSIYESYLLSAKLSRDFLAKKQSYENQLSSTKLKRDIRAKEQEDIDD